MEKAEAREARSSDMDPLELMRTLRLWLPSQARINTQLSITSAAGSAGPTREEDASSMADAFWPVKRVPPDLFVPQARSLPARTERLPDDRGVRCRTCGAAFEDRAALANHVRGVHALACSHCERVFFSRHWLDLHEDESHNSLYLELAAASCSVRPGLLSYTSCCHDSCCSFDALCRIAPSGSVLSQSGPSTS
jgi:hypothetical protein